MDFSRRCHPRGGRRASAGRLRGAAGVVVVVGLSGCWADPPIASTPCEQAFVDAAELLGIDPSLHTDAARRERTEEFVPAVRACGSVEEWTAAAGLVAAEFPDSPRGADVVGLLRERCAEEALRDERVCEELASASDGG